MLRQALCKTREPVVVLQKLLGFGQKGFAGAGERHAAAGALKQHNVKMFFNRFDLRRHGRLRQVQAFGRLGEVAVMGNGYKAFNLVVVHIFLVWPAGGHFAAFRRPCCIYICYF